MSHDPKEFLRMIGVTPVEDQDIAAVAPGERKLTGGLRGR
jgi:hypothetical protein